MLRHDVGSLKLGVFFKVNPHFIITMEKLTKEEARELVEILNEGGYKVTIQRVQLKTKIMAMAA